MNIFIVFIIGAIIVQYLVERCKALIPTSTPEKLRALLIPYIALGWGIAIAFLAKMDIMAAVGLPLSFVALSYIIAGIFISGGSVFVNEVIKAIMALRSTNDTGKDDTDDQGV